MVATDSTPEAAPGEIVWADVQFLSLCIGGKTGLKGLYKSDDGAKVRAVPFMVKAADAFDERGELLVCVYPPKLEDDDRNWASAETIEQMAHGCMRKGIQLDIQHDGEPVPASDAAVVESFIIQKGDARFDGMEHNGKALPPDALAGGWGALVKLDNPVLRAAYREGGWSGISLGGPALIAEGRSPVQAAKATVTEAVGAVRRALRRMLRGTATNEAGTLRDLTFNVRVPRLGETDFDGNPRMPSFDVHISGDLSR